MYFREDTQAAAELLKQAIPLMVKRKIPTNPCNIALWYAYAAGLDKNLNQALETHFPDNTQYAPEKSEELFFDYFIKSYMPSHEGAQEAMVSLLTRLYESTKKTADGTREYGSALQKGLDQFKNETDPREMEKTLVSLLEETRAVDHLTRRFTQEIDSAKQEIESLKQQLKDTEKSVFVDSLTKIGNRRSFDRTLVGAMVKTNAELSLLLIDLDNFKKCNDTYGHLTGDRVLAGVGQLLESHKSENIHVSRYGGEEFAVIVRQKTREQVHDLAEMIRTQVMKIQIKQQGRYIGNISTSIGIAERKPGESRESLIHRADQALYSAKQNGRNQVKISD